MADITENVNVKNASKGSKKDKIIAGIAFGIVLIILTLISHYSK